MNDQTERLRERKEKNIIYVDAASLNGRYKIGLYDKAGRRKDTLLLGKAVKHIHTAEQYAILYGLMYIHKRGKEDKYILMNDSESAVQNNELSNLAARLNTKLLWIPREINKADKVSRQKPNKKKKVWHHLHFFMNIIAPKSFIDKEKPLTKETDISLLNPVVKIVYQELLAKRDSFPMTTSDFSKIVTAVYNQEDIEMKKGDSIRVRQELSKNNIIHVKNKVVALTI